MRSWKLAGWIALVAFACALSAALAGESHRIMRFDGYVEYVSKDGRQIGLKTAVDATDVTLYIIDERVVGAKKLKEVASKLRKNAFVTVRYYTKRNVNYIVGFGWPYREAKKKKEGGGGGEEEEGE